MSLHPLSKKPKDVKARGPQYGNTFDPEFEVDVLIYVPQGIGEDIPPIKARAEVGLAVFDEDEEPVFMLAIRASSVSETVQTDLMDRYVPNHVNNGSYTIDLSKVATGSVRSDSYDDWGVVLPKNTREEMLVWWDEHSQKPPKEKSAAWQIGYDYGADHDLDWREFAVDGGTPMELAAQWFDGNIGDIRGGHELGTIANDFWEMVRSLEGDDQLNDEEARAGWITALAEHIQHERDERPPQYEVERLLRKAGLPVSSVGNHGVHWSVNAWALGDGLYLTDEGGENDFALVRRDMQSDDDEIIGLAEGTLQEMIALASKVLETEQRRR